MFSVLFKLSINSNSCKNVVLFQRSISPNIHSTAFEMVLFFNAYHSLILTCVSPSAANSPRYCTITIYLCCTGSFSEYIAVVCINVRISFSIYHPLSLFFYTHLEELSLAKWGLVLALRLCASLRLALLLL